MILEKSSIEITTFFFFCVQNIEQVTIPSFFKHIGAYSFYGCLKLKQVEFSSNSELLTVGNCAFTRSAIEKYSIPLHLRKIGKYCFLCCQKLRPVEISSNSELQEIDVKAFN